MPKFSTTYFPFVPGIPFQLRNNYYVEPKLGSDHWNKLFENKSTHIVCYGGFIENIISLSVAEAILKNKPSQKIYYITNPFLKSIWRASSVARESNISIKKSILRKYPSPVFFNKDQSIVFFNVLNNYLDVYSYRGEKRYEERKAACWQIFRNSMIEWDKSYLPQFRNLNMPDVLRKYCKTYNLDLAKPFILLLPDVTGYSDNSVMGMEWGKNEVRSFVEMSKNTKYNVVMMSSLMQSWHGLKAFVMKFDIEVFLYLVSKCKILISKEIDYALSGLMLSDCKIFSMKYNNAFGISKNRRYVKTDNELYLSDKLSPYEVYDNLK